jgi:6-pyruvoyltetrahydropterin/6-carboxytetrahydropterin synthase
MIYITRRVEFCASHRLHNPALSDEANADLYGKCNNPGGHGHTYVLEVTVKGPLNPETGMLMDLRDLGKLLEQEIVDRVDHKNLNMDVELLEAVIPTAENLAVVFWNLLEKALPENCRVHEVRLWESENSLVLYRGEGPEQVARFTPGTGGNER